MTTVRRTAITFCLALSTPTLALADTPFDLDDAGWRAEVEAIVQRVDAEIAAGAAAAPRGGVHGIHGLVRTHVISGDFSGLPPQDAEHGPEFGYAVAIHGDWLAVGAPATVYPATFDGTAAHGAVFVFRRQAGAWIQVQRILPYTSPASSTRCGHAVALHFPHLLVGCPQSEAVGAVPGEVRGTTVFYHFDAQDQQFLRHWLLHGDADDRCGTAVALTQNHAAHGCPRQAGGGSVYVHGRDPETGNFPPGSWQVVLMPDSPLNGARFGSAVAIHEPPQLPPTNVRIAVGAPLMSYGWSGGFASGAAYVFSRALSTPTWTQTTELTLQGHDNASFSAFGSAVALNSTHLLVGAPNRFLWGSASLPRTGAAYRFQRSGVNWQAVEIAYPLLGLPEDTVAAGMRYGATVALGFDQFSLVGGPEARGPNTFGGMSNAVGVMEVRRLGGSFGYVQPGPIGPLALSGGQFASGVDSDNTRRIVAAGYPRAGTALSGRRGQVWLLQPDRLFGNGFQCASGLPGC